MRIDYLSMPVVTLGYNRYKKADSKHDAVIEVNIAYQGRRKVFSTRQRVFPNQWQHGRVVNRPDAQEINKYLDQLMADVKKVLNQMIEEGYIDIFAVPKYLSRLRCTLPDFFEFCEKRITVRQYGRAADSQERYDRFMRFLRSYGKIRDFSDITEEKIIQLDDYLKAKKMKAKSIWNNYHRFLNAFILDAISEGLIKKNPYKSLNIDKGEDQNGLDKCLTPEELKKIETAEICKESLLRVRDLFVFQTYTCLSYKDLRAFDSCKIQEEGEMKVYMGVRGKSHRGKPGWKFTVPMLQPAFDILKKYGNKVPIISNQKYNKGLKKLAVASGIDKPLSTHWARHTGATLLLNVGVPMQVVSKILGHSSTKMTERVYAKLLDRTVVDAVNDVADKLV